MKLKTGALTHDELLAIWRGALDRSYSDPLEAAGEGQGLEAHTQAIAQFARLSRAVDVTTQAMYLQPSSAQTAPPASGGAKAVVLLTIRRRHLLHAPMILAPGDVWIGEETTDATDDGAEVVLTGRRYTLTEYAVFAPGEAGPIEVWAEAEQTGCGYNNPLPGTIRRIDQPGAGFENRLARVEVAPGVIAGGQLASSARATIVTPNVPDTFVPSHVGQYVVFTDGLNTQSVARVTIFGGPDLAAVPPVGSTADLEWVHAVEAPAAAGEFVPGEVVERAGATWFGTAVGQRTRDTVRLVVVHRAGAPLAPGDVLVGQSSGAVLIVGSVLFGQDFVAEAPVGVSGGAAWRVLDWAVDWGVEITHAESPSGGVAPWLDELGFERDLSRAPGEGDESYRQRIAAVSDVVTPNAILRALTRTLGSVGWCFREAGTERLRGFFFDGDLAPPSSVPHGPLNDAYDYSVRTFTGAGSIPGAWRFQEPVELIDGTGGAYGRGWYGGAPDPTRRAFVPDGVWHLPSPLPPGFRMRGIETGSYWEPATEVANNYAEPRRYNVWLDYVEFRGFFLVSLPPYGLGEFGFAYDANGAYDVPGQNAYDGWPYLNSLIYAKAWQAIDTIRAGGVSIGLRLDSGPCE